MTNLITVSKSVEMLNSQDEAQVLYQARIMQKFLSFFEGLNADQESFSKTLKTAFLSMIQLHPENAEEAMRVFADLSKMVLMSVEYHDNLIEQSNNFNSIQKQIEAKEAKMFASRSQEAN